MQFFALIRAGRPAGRSSSAPSPTRWPKRQLFVSDLPKIRNTKILRRVVKAVVTGDPGDLTALLNPDAIEELKRVVGES